MVKEEEEDPQEPVDENETTEGQTGEGGEENGTLEKRSPGYSIIVEGGSNTVDISEIELVVVVSLKKLLELFTIQMLLIVNI